MNQAPWLVVGLGNPGPTYAGTRHNIGATSVATWVGELGGTLGAHRRGRADVYSGHVGPLGHAAVKVVAAVPRSFMNESGGPVAALVDFFKVPKEHLVVVHDELDLPLGGLRLKFGGGDNGHNGLKSIRASIGTGDFYRVRLGIGRPPGRQDPAEFVLRRFAGPQSDEAAHLCAIAGDAVTQLITEGLEKAQNAWNT